MGKIGSTLRTKDRSAQKRAKEKKRRAKKLADVYNSEPVIIRTPRKKPTP